MEEERLQLASSGGLWHRAQRDRVSFEAACYYSYEPELPLGCQYARSNSPEWRDQDSRAAQRAALEALYQGTGGPDWRYNDNWLVGDPCWDFWYGVTCDEHGNVIYLELVDNRMAGNLPSQIGDLIHLIKLDLSSTEEVYFSHPNLDLNRLKGGFPSIRNLYKISEIEISGNLFTALPGDLSQNAVTIRVLSASRNLLKRFPSGLGNFEKLHTLELGRNQISERLPAAIGQLAEARVVQLEYNQIEGVMPSDITNMGKVEVFDISHNVGLTGLVPETILVDWPNAKYLSIYNTSLGGYISSLCIDIPFCWKFQYDTHRDMTWATAADVPDIVNVTITLALKNAQLANPVT